MWAEDYPEPGVSHTPELVFLIFSATLGVLLMWWLAHWGYIINSLLVTALVAAPCLVFYHVREEFGERSRPLLSFGLMSLPVVAALAWFVVGIFNPAVETVVVNGQTFLSLRETIGPGPTTTLPELSWLPFLAGLALYLLALVGLYVVDNEWTLGRLLTVLSASAVLAAMVGWVQEGLRLAGEPLEEVWLVRFFVHPHFPALATLWFGVATVLTAFRIERLGWWSFLGDAGLLRLTMWATLGSAAIYCGGPLERWSATALAVGLFASLTIGRLCTPPRELRAVGWYALLAVLVAAGGLALMQVAPEAAGGATASAKEELRWQLWERLVAERPFWGWGGGSFTDLVLFFQPVEFPVGGLGTPPSSLLRLVLEQGMPGVALWTLAVLVPLVGFVRLRVFANHSFGLLCVCALGVAFVIYTGAMRYTAFAFSLWLIFFVAVRWSQILDLRAKRRSARHHSTMVFKAGSPNVAAIGTGERAKAPRGAGAG
ncbi:MAG: O-antigen ligase family protein [Opitutales bacterium]